MTRSSLLEAELEAVTETGLYQSKESFLLDAVQTLFAARPDLREVVACRLYEKGVLSLGRTAEWSGLSIESLKERLHQRGISRHAPESLEETEAMARAALRAAGRETVTIRALQEKDHYGFRADVLARLLG